jgi:hypothetical protein
MDLAAELQKIYDTQINVSIILRCGFEVLLGDKVHGFLAQETT